MIQVSDLQSSVAQFRNFTRADIVGRRRFVPLARARHEAMYLARAMTPHSLVVIARLFNLTNHTSALHGIRRTTERLSSEPELRAELAMLAYFSEPIR